VGIFYKNSNADYPVIVVFFLYPLDKYGATDIDSEIFRIQNSYMQMPELEQAINCKSIDESFSFANSVKDFIGFTCTHGRYFIGSQRDSVVHNDYISMVDDKYVINISIDYLPHQEATAMELVRSLIKQVGLPY
jgi:cytochrome oxidase Cu insertion factor (SCO1/SenC/PrrC family)